MRYRTLVRRLVRARRGFGLIEAMIALVILAGAVLSAGRYFTQLTRGVADERTRAQALSLVGERFEQVKTSPTYAKIDSLYVGVESNIAGYAGYTRLTQVQRVGGQPSDTVDYKIITVTVTTPAIPKSVTVVKSTIIGDW
jgi:prepilin-type N-terminal cleavage/methylation domain-containing protein